MSVKLRSRKISEDEYSLYFDEYNKDKRQTYTFTGGKVSKDYIKYPELKYANRRDKEVFEEALRELAKRNKELSLNDVFEQLNVDPLEDDIDLFEYIEEKQDECFNSRKKAYERLKVNVKKFQTGPISLREIDIKWLKLFKSYLVKKLKGTTVDTYLNTMKILLDEAVEENIIPISPFPKKGFFLRVRSEKKSIKDYLTFDELQSLHEMQLDSEVCRAFIFSCFTGLRISDVERLKWTDIYNDVIRIVQYKTRNQNEEENIIPLHADALRILESQDKIQEEVFDLPNRSEIHTALKFWANVVGLGKNLHFHMARHTFAAMFLQEGSSIYTLSQILGHASVETTQKFYGHLIDKARHEQIKKMPTLSHAYAISD